MKLRSMLAVAAILLAGGTGLAATTTADAQQAFLSHDQVVAEIAPSVPLVRTAYGHGSGVLISPRLVATNPHVIYPFDTAAIVSRAASRSSDRW